MKITGHRPNQVGGCITEIESDLETRIIIDVGSNLPRTVSEEVYVKELTKGCAGVFVMHYHGDHVGGISVKRRKLCRPRPDRFYLARKSRRQQSSFQAYQRSRSRANYYRSKRYNPPGDNIPDTQPKSRKI